MLGHRGRSGFTAQDVLDTMADLFVKRGVPQYIRSVREWLDTLEVGTLFIEPGSPWENGYYGSFNGRLRDELFNGEIFGRLGFTRYHVHFGSLQFPPSH